MPRRSKTELQGLVDRIVAMYVTEGKRQRDIADELSAQGYQISRGAVQRTLKNHSAYIKELREKQEWAKTLIEATNKTPRLDIPHAALQIVALKLAEEVGEANFKDMDDEKKALTLARITRAIGLASNVELNFERGRKQGLLDAGKKLEEAAASLGISDEKMAVIKAEVFGLNK